LNSNAVGKLFGVYFLNETEGWVVGIGGQIVSTVDGGDSWNSETSNVSTSLNAVYMIDENTGWIVGASGTILQKTASSGGWVRVTTVSTTTNLNDVKFLADGVTGYIVGAQGLVLRTLDGNNWDFMSAGTAGTLWAIATAPPNNVWIVGDAGALEKLGADGVSWMNEDPGVGPAIALRGVYFIDANRGFLAGKQGTFMES